MTKDDTKKNASKEVKKAGGVNVSTTFKVEEIKSELNKFGPIRTLNVDQVNLGKNAPHSQNNRMTRMPGTNIVIVPVAFKGNVYHFKVTFSSIGETDMNNIPYNIGDAIREINKHLTK
jgi:hypothetical protein